MYYTLKRVSDGAGDSGTMSDSYKTDPSLTPSQRVTHNAEPTIGESLMVGSHFARSYQMQDWWCTTPVIEIISDEIVEEGHDKIRLVKFKTGNSEYEWTCAE